MGSTPVHEQLQKDMRLFIAIEHGDEAAFGQALATGGNPYVQDSTGETLLHKAANSDRVSPRFFRRVLELGIDPDSRSEAGETPLHLAVWKDNAYVVRSLLKAGADPNAAGANGLTPFHVVVPHDRPVVPMLLHLAGGDAEIPDKQGRTPLEYHIGKGQGFILDDYFDWKERQSQCDPTLQPPTAAAVTAWDNPFCADEVTLATWRQLPAALQAAQAEQAAIPPMVLTRIAASASSHFVLPQALEAMHAAGYRLQADALIDPTGQQPQELLDITRNGDLPLLFTRENWKGAAVQDLSEALAVLNSEQRDELKNISQLRVGIQRDAVTPVGGRRR